MLVPSSLTRVIPRARELRGARGSLTVRIDPSYLEEGWVQGLHRDLIVEARGMQEPKA